ncbi:ABC-type transport system, involved in lipoprotein release, permease component [Lachnospiraceae bacterium]|nr:ABC-type transport system, involved in lipoprotein release, permease component [Lachnospiraceae bacterium]
MEIYTLVKAGIKNRKGIMTGFMILTMLIVISVITMFGVRRNFESALNRAFEVEDKGVIFAHFTEENYSEELMDKVRAQDTVDHIEVHDDLVGVNVAIGDKKEGNGYFIIKKPDTIPIYNEDCTELIMPDSPEYKDLALKKGEIYLPYGLKNELDARVGSKIEMDFLNSHETFTVKGFVQEAYMGSAVVGYKLVFLSDDDFDKFYKSNKESVVDPVTDGWVTGKIVFVFPTEKADESSNIFLRDLTLKTKFNDMAKATMTRETSEHYTGLFIEIILAVITAFAILLFVIFLIVAGHNISTEMEIEYRNLGILKSQGFSDKKIQAVYVIQYLMVELIGILLGVIISIPCERIMSKVFFSLTAILPEKKLPIIESLIFTVLLFLITVIYVYIFTRKISKTSPVKAITNGHEDFYFDSRLNVPLRKNGMSFWLGLRQITSAPKRYISTVIVTVLLIFTIITTELMSGYIQSRNALISMGEPFLDIEFAFQGAEPKCKVVDIENIIEKYTEIEARLYKSHIYTSVNGESMMTFVKAYPDELSSVYKGREIKYDNEIIITEQVSKLLEVGIGDTVTVGRNNYSEEYVVVGIFQTMNDTGKAVALSLDGISRLKENPDEKYTLDQLSMYGVILKDISKGEEIVKEVKNKYGDDIEIKFNDFNGENAFFIDDFYTAANGSKLLIYILSFVFAIVTIVMVCTKAFIQERTDLGIYRATGFSVRKVRNSFAARFMIISLISAVAGVILSRLYSAKLLASLFSLFGIPHIELEYGPMFFIRPIIIFALCYLLFGYIASRRVKKLSARELITE